MSDISLNDLHLDLDTDLIFERAEENLLSSVSGNDSPTYEVDLSNVEDYLKRGLFLPNQGYSSPYLGTVTSTVVIINARLNSLTKEIQYLNTRIDALFVLVFIIAFVPWIKSIVRRLMFKKNKED